MGIVHHEKLKIFQIHTKNTTYMMGVYAGIHLQHLYYGRSLTDPDCASLFPRKETPAMLHAMKRGGADQVYSGDFLMKAGYPMDMLWGDNNSVLLHFEKQEKDNYNTKEG